MKTSNKRDYQLTYDESVIRLAKTCIFCGGDGCLECDERGFMLTKSGRELLALCSEFFIMKDRKSIE